MYVPVQPQQQADHQPNENLGNESRSAAPMSAEPGFEQTLGEALNRLPKVRAQRTLQTKLNQNPHRVIQPKKAGAVPDQPSQPTTEGGQGKVVQLAKGKRNKKKRAEKRFQEEQRLLGKEQRKTYAGDLEELAAVREQLHQMEPDLRIIRSFYNQRIRTSPHLKDKLESIREMDPVGANVAYKTIEPTLEALRRAFDEILQKLPSAMAPALAGPVQETQQLLDRAENYVAVYYQTLGQAWGGLGINQKLTPGLPQVPPSSDVIAQVPTHLSRLKQVNEEHPETRFDQLSQEFEPVPENDFNVNLSGKYDTEQLALTLQQEHRVTVTGGPWHRTPTGLMNYPDRLPDVSEVWKKLPQRHVKFNDYVKGVSMERAFLGPDNQPDYQVMGLHHGDRMFVYRDSDGQEKFKGTVAHETGHAVHAKSRFLLEDFTKAGGWQSKTKGSVMRELMKGGQTKTQAEESVREIVTNTSRTFGDRAYRKADDSGELFWVRPFGSLPEDERINPGEQSEYSYAKTAPWEHFAEMYRLMYENPELAFQDWVAGPHEALESAKKTLGEVDNPENQKRFQQASATRLARSKQWNIMRNLVFGTDRTEAAVLGMMQGAPTEMKAQFLATARSLGTPAQILALPEVKRFQTIQEQYEELLPAAEKGYIPLKRLTLIKSMAFQAEHESGIYQVFRPLQELVEEIESAFQELTQLNAAPQEFLLLQDVISQSPDAQDVRYAMDKIAGPLRVQQARQGYLKRFANLKAESHLVEEFFKWSETVNSLPELEEGFHKFAHPLLVRQAIEQGFHQLIFAKTPKEIVEKFLLFANEQTDIPTIESQKRKILEQQERQNEDDEWDN